MTKVDDLIDKVANLLREGRFEKTEAGYRIEGGLVYAPPKKKAVWGAVLKFGGHFKHPDFDGVVGIGEDDILYLEGALAQYAADRILHVWKPE